jgi:ABC-type multidrug transport system fused ATPase/permease subunit
MSQVSSTAQEQLKRLGAGGSGDRLHFRLVLEVMGRCFPLLREVKWHLVGIVAAAASLAVALVPPTFQLIDVFWTRVLKGDKPTEKQVALLKLFGVACDPWTDAARKAGLRALVGGTVGLSLIAAVGFLSLYYYRMWILQRINQDLRLRLLDRLQALSLRFHNDSAVGDAMYRMHQDSAMVTQLIDVIFLMPLQNFGRFAFSIVLVALYNPTLALVLGAGWPIALYIGYRFSRPMRVGFRSAREHNSALTSLIQASLQGIRVIKAYGVEHAEQERFEQASKAAFAHAYVARDRYMLYHTLMFWLFGVLVVVATGWAGILTMHGAALSSKTLLLFFGFSVWNVGLWNNFKSRIGDGMASSVSLFQLWGRMQDIAIGLDRVFEMLDLEPEVKDAPDAVEMPAFTKSIDLEGVSFAYDSTRPTLQDVSLSAQIGTITAIVGPTGSGKSTLMSLLLRLYDPSAGAIRIDGLDVRKIKLQSLRANIAIALQENVLFGTTIRENIRYAVPNASDAAVREAARVAGADEFIDKLPDGYDTLLGERGQKLSTGQRQRLSIARAILKDTPILILDEPTAALDARTELRVLDNLAKWCKGRAVFLITHRLSTIRRADQVGFIQDGRLLEHGSHDSLMARTGGAYRHLVEGEEAAARAQPRAAVGT